MIRREMKATCAWAHRPIRPQFAVRAIRQWWRSKGEKRYPNAKGILIEADAGGSNGCRPRLWKIELQRWANEDGLDITVCHYPRGASKWNPIEHRLFSPISRNWAGHPLRSLDVMLGFIRGVTTNGGLKVGAVLDRRKIPKRHADQQTRNGRAEYPSPQNLS